MEKIRVDIRATSIAGYTDGHDQRCRTCLCQVVGVTKDLPDRYPDLEILIWLSAIAMALNIIEMLSFKLINFLVGMIQTCEHFQNMSGLP